MSIGSFNGGAAPGGGASLKAVKPSTSRTIMRRIGQRPRSPYDLPQQAQSAGPQRPAGPRTDTTPVSSVGPSPPQITNPPPGPRMAERAGRSGGPDTVFGAAAVRGMGEATGEGLWRREGVGTVAPPPRYGLFGRKDALPGEAFAAGGGPRHGADLSGAVRDFEMRLGRGAVAAGMESPGGIPEGQPAVSYGGLDAPGARQLPPEPQRTQYGSPTEASAQEQYRPYQPTMQTGSSALNLDGQIAENATTGQGASASSASSASSGATNNSTEAQRLAAKYPTADPAFIDWLLSNGFTVDSAGNVVTAADAADGQTNNALGELGGDWVTGGDPALKQAWARAQAAKEKADKERSDAEDRAAVQRNIDEIRNQAPPTSDPSVTNQAVSEARQRQAYETSRSMRAALEAASRGGTDVGAQAGMIGELSHQGGIAGAAQETQIRGQAEVRNFQARLAQYNSQIAALMQQAQTSGNREQQRQAYQYAMALAQHAARTQAELIRLQQELANQISPAQIAGLLGGAAGVGLGAWTSGLGAAKTAAPAAG